MARKFRREGLQSGQKHSKEQDEEALTHLFHRRHHCREAIEPFDVQAQLRITSLIDLPTASNHVPGSRAASSTARRALTRLAAN